MRRQFFALTFVAFPLAVALPATFDDKAPAAAQGAKAAAPAGIEIDALDRKIDPCTDFYQFACGGWIAKNPVPADRRCTAGSRSCRSATSPCCAGFSKRRAPTATARRPPTFTPPAWTRRRSRPPA